MRRRYPKFDGCRALRRRTSLPFLLRPPTTPLRRVRDDSWVVGAIAFYGPVCSSASAYADAGSIPGPDCSAGESPSEQNSRNTAGVSGLSTGYRGNATWREMSEYAVHVIKAAPPSDEYFVMLKILSEGRILPSGPFGAARNLEELGDSQKSACLSEIPLDLLERLIERRSLYGIGFRQDLLTTRGGARVWYLDKAGRAADSFKEVVRAARSGGIDPDDRSGRSRHSSTNPATTPDCSTASSGSASGACLAASSSRPRTWRLCSFPRTCTEPLAPSSRTLSATTPAPRTSVPYVDPRWEMQRVQQAFASVRPAPTFDATTAADRSGAGSAFAGTRSCDAPAPNGYHQPLKPCSQAEEQGIMSPLL